MRAHLLVAALLPLPLLMCGSDSGGNAGTGSSSDGGANGDAAGSSDGAATSDSGAQPAPHLNIDLSSSSVSGISSGGYMAVQMHMAFSSIMKGAAVFAGGPFDCSGGSQTTAVTSCTSGSPAIDVPSLVTATNQLASSGAIDDPSSLASQHIFIFGGADDMVVNPKVVDALDAYYASFAPPASIQYVNRRPGTSHTWPTLDFGNDCDTVASPYLGKCNYDGAGEALAQIYGPLNARTTAPTGTIVPIAQTDYVDDAAGHSLGDTAYAYVPASCAAGDSCKIHVSFHGCLQSASLVGDAFYTHSGLNEWADSNHIVVLYPQTIASSQNPEACWDFWGYESPDFAKKTGPQLAMVRAMMDALAKK